MRRTILECAKPWLSFSKLYGKEKNSLWHFGSEDRLILSGRIRNSSKCIKKVIGADSLVDANLKYGFCGVRDKLENFINMIFEKGEVLRDFRKL